MMSITSSVLIIFYLCACSLHACNARRLGLIDNGGFGKQLYFPSKVVDHEVEVINMDSTKTGAAYSGDSIGNYKSHGGPMISTQKTKAMKYSTEEEEKEEEEAIPGSIPPIKPIVSVSNSNWHVSHNKNGHEQHIPGFYSDYSRPRTRPPSHN